MVESFLNLPLAGLWKGFLDSNLVGIVIVVIQVALSVVAGAIIIGKFKELNTVGRGNKRFMREFTNGRDVLEYYLNRKTQRQSVSLELMYVKTCERMVKLIDPLTRSRAIKDADARDAVALTGKEIALLRGNCEHIAEDEEIRLDKGMTMLAFIVTTAPMLGLLGTVWGVLDAFDLMGGKGTVLLSEIAPAISSALVTTVVGLMVAIPASGGYNWLSGKMREITSDMDGFIDELLGRIAREYQGRDD
ncbi:MAG: MotA/TolQ/ExbB proton channel family protein [Kiritimatiellae bacterium]|nr:MotA/TolQ/ExbB proton channel family protein [Kiritimatiellia bacterium]